MSDPEKNQIQDISRLQRRVLGALMEKGFTTPEQYPLTLKATTSACNQKSNRDPTVSYSEDQVMEGLDRLRENGLVAEVFPGGGRTARYRHYMRHCFDFSEAQFAIIAELLLRGRQQLGELRTRASRMVRIESMEQLRQQLIDLQQKGYLQANGPLDRRGIEVDHSFYLDKENMTIGGSSSAVDSPSPDSSSGDSPPQHNQESSCSAEPSATASGVNHQLAGQLERFEQIIQQLRSTVQEQASLIHELEHSQTGLQDRLDKLERDLGG